MIAQLVHRVQLWSCREDVQVEFQLGFLVLGQAAKNQHLVLFELCLHHVWPLVNLGLVALVMESNVSAVVGGKLDGTVQAPRQGDERSYFAFMALTQKEAGGWRLDLEALGARFVALSIPFDRDGLQEKKLQQSEFLSFEDSTTAHSHVLKEITIGCF
jgi:hypothetical protein